MKLDTESFDGYNIAVYAVGQAEGEIGPPDNVLDRIAARHPQ